MKRVLINASNLHAGGGVQVAASFILELSKMLRRFTSYKIYVFASSAVNDNLMSCGFNRTDIERYQVLDVRGMQALKGYIAEQFYGFDLVFTIFGPLYLPRKVPNHVVGFAQSWIIYPRNETVGKLPLRSRLTMRIKFLLQWWFFKMSARLVVEQEHVKKGIENLKSFPSDQIDVVNNCFSEIYLDESRWRPLSTLECLDDEAIKLGYLTRDYPHKNIDFLDDVSRELQRISTRKYRFVVTLTETEWLRRSPEFRSHVFNVGSISVAQCPTFYRAMDAVFFPSLLESFSATPLEAMVMRLPLFASNRGFVRDCCGDHALYFDPIDAEQAARRIEDWFSRTLQEVRMAHIEDAYRHVRSLPGSRERAAAYVKIINKQLAI
ncbi:glycosyltransferase [Aromatoleum anaerobium]|uniref:Glycosyltransferase n=1 Tax=Aromatoleum anaerobium TaxID=182180 RepID=A0ABX1PLW9_9RHOO|nr:glycosyltransferase [Aromatoleum anaerobium]MCK0505744.1 glycosyltransferase [Aromatoleum anaerobium]